LDAGYNVLLEVGETVISASGRRATTVTVHGDPGEGEGFFGGCNEEGASEDRPVYSLGGATADEHGNLFLTGDDCYRVTQSQLHELLVEMNCRPCCSCDDHVAVYRAIKNDWDTARDLGAQAMEIRDEFQEAITTWNAQVACAENEQLRAILIPWNGGSASIAAAYCHSKNVCLPTVVMRFEFVLSGTDEPMDDTDVELVANSIMIEGTDIDPELVTLSGFWPNYSYTFTNVDAMSAIQARFQVKFDRAKLGGSASLDLTVRVGLTNKTVSKALI
jgi:hypothetical protein